MNMKHEQGISTFRGISIILMEVVVVVFVFYFLYYFWIENPVPTDNILVVRTFHNTAVTIPSTVDISGWLEYTSDTYGFSLHYPVGYQVAEDKITYGSSDGHIISLVKNDAEAFWLHIFPRQDAETIAQVFQRLTTVDPTVYQSFNQRVSGAEAVAYRLTPGQVTQDHVYFIGNNYFFESPLNAFSAPILGTLTFVK